MRQSLYGRHGGSEKSRLNVDQELEALSTFSTNAAS